MKRREFLRSAVSVTGSLIPALAAASRVPCPPQSLVARGGSTAKGACDVAPGGSNSSVPRWVADVPVSSGWQPLAGGAEWPGLKPWQRGSRLIDVAPSPIPSYPGYGGFDTIIRSWCGGTVDPARKEVLLVLNGGHSSSPNNASYALQLSEAVPAWKRLCDPTPNDRFDMTAPPGKFSPSDVPAVHLDGRPRGSHTAGNVQFAKGRAWFILQTSVSCGAGTSAQGIVSFNRDAVATLPGDFAPYSTYNPYSLHGIAGATGGPSGYIFGSSAYDPVDGLVWGYGQSHCWALDVDTGSIAIPPTLTGRNFGSKAFKGAWAVCLPDRRVNLVGLTRTAGQAVYVHDLTKPIGAGAFTLVNTTPTLDWDPDSYWINYAAPTTPNDGLNNAPYVLAGADYSRGSFAYGLGAVYSGGRVYVGPVPCRRTGTLGGEVRVLDPHSMTWTELSNPGMRPVALAGEPMSPGTQWGNFQRFNIVEWGGIRVLVHAADTHGPTHVWRIA
jgi:hypothetical protein